jgi:hypothetical protein
MSYVLILMGNIHNIYIYILILILMKNISHVYINKKYIYDIY